MKKAAAIATFILIGFLPGIFGSRFQPDVWYEGLTKPLLTPPAMVFPIAWTILYCMIGISGYLFFGTVSDTPKKHGYGVYAINLSLNGIWSYLFFGCHLIGWALADIVLLAVAIAVNIYVFTRVNRLSGILQVPYLIWVLFATYLNAALYVLNR